MKPALPLALLLGMMLILPTAPLAHADDPSGDGRGKILDLSFENAPIGQVMEELARLSGRNVVVAPDVQGTVTIKLSNVDWRKAFGLLGQAHGLDVLHQDGNITIVRKRTGTPRRVKLRTAARRAAEAEAAEASTRAMDLENEIAASKARIAKLEREIARAEANRLRASESVAKARASEVLPRDAEFVLEEPVRSSIQVHDVKDLVTAHEASVVKLAEKVKKKGALVQWHDSNLIVRGTPPMHAAFAQGLDELRAKMAKGVLVTVDPNGTKRRVRLVDGAAVESKGRFVEWRDVKKHVAEAKQPVEAVNLVRLEDHMKVMQTRMANAEKQMADRARQIENLARALEHLKKAGVKAEAERVARQLAASKDRYAQARAELAQVKAGLAKAHAEATRVAQKRRSVALGFTSAGRAQPSARGTAPGMASLRDEVRALRGEVRELTGLVRELLDLQKERGPRRRSR